ncbi:MAG: acyltransferase family protein [Chitinophagaceae bacterium]
MSQPSQRFLALDIFRGMTVCFMIIVNTPGNGATTYSPLLHATWNGFTPTDLVFPSFMFAVGNSMSFVMEKWAKLSQAQVLGKIFKRTLIIFLLGFLMYWFPFVHYNDQHQLVANPFDHTRVMGVLQRIALGYCLASLMIYYLRPVRVFTLSVVLLLLYWLILLLFGETGDPYNMVTNAGTKLDMWLLGPNHLYHGEGIAFDPEGVLSTLPAITNVTFGWLAGKWIQRKGKEYEGLAKLLLAGALFIVVALAWHPFFPINKKLWTGSFVLLTVGIDCIILAVLIYITDFLQQKKWGYFFEVFGKNPLFIYLLSEVGAILLWFFGVGEKYQPLYSWVYENVFSRTGMYFGSFLFAISFMLVCWLVGYMLDKRKIYIRV